MATFTLLVSSYWLFFTFDVVIIDTSRKGISKGVLVTVATVAVACTLLNSSVLTVVIKKRHENYKQTSSRKYLRKFLIWKFVLKTD